MRCIGMSDNEQNLTLLSAPASGAKARASSVLQKNVKVYGPAHALDTDNPSTCWNSEGNQGDTHWLSIDFGRTVCVQQIKVQFQAGFAAESGLMQVVENDGSNKWIAARELEFEDTYELQTEATTEIHSNGHTTTAVRFVFQDFTDFYGRVTIYRLEIWGKEV